MEPVYLRPIIKRALWGGRRLELELGKQTGGIGDAAESWEVVDLPGDRSLVEGGEFHGMTLRELMSQQERELLGQHASGGRFPLMVKFLDAQHQLSVQVHPQKPIQLPDGSSRSGKAEAWVVMAAKPHSRMFLGLQPGVTEADLRIAAATGHVDTVLRSYEPRPGDCIYLPPGAIHSLGGGILVAEIQQPSDITFRLHDWGRRDAHGQQRELHFEQALREIDFAAPPIQVRPADPSRKHEELLSCRHFVIHRRRGQGTWSLPLDQRLHVVVVLAGEVGIEGQVRKNLQRGQTVLLPAMRRPLDLELSSDAVLLDVFLPEQAEAAGDAAEPS